MNCCQNPKITDLSQGLGDERNYYCKSCKSHFYKGKVYTEKEWDDWIEDWDSMRRLAGSHSSQETERIKTRNKNLHLIINDAQFGITKSAVAAAVGGEGNKSTTE